MATLHCIRCGSDEVSGGYVSCNSCGKEWHPDDTDEGEAIRLFVEKVADFKTIDPSTVEHEILNRLIEEARKLCGK